MTAPRMFRWEWAPEPAWQHALDQVFTPSAGLGRLVVRWSPGLEEHPTQRWVIDQLIPLRACFTMDYRQARVIPIPAMQQYLDVVERPAGAPWPAPHHLRLWRTLQDTGCLAVPFWIVQGHQGGHKLQYDRLDQIWAQFRTGRLDAPRPGALPYAPFDRRVVDALVAQDRFRGAYADCLAESEGRVQDAERRVRELLAAETDASVGAVCDEVGRGVLAMDLPRQERPVDYRELTDAYVETGQIAGTGASMTAGEAIGLRPA